MKDNRLTFTISDQAKKSLESTIKEALKDIKSELDIAGINECELQLTFYNGQTDWTIQARRVQTLQWEKR